MRCGVNGSRVDMESSTTSSGRHCLLCPCASQVGQRRAEGDSCSGQRAKRRPASQLITKRHGWLMLLIFTFGYTEEEPTPFPEITVTSRNVARQEQHPKQDRHVLLAHSGQTQSPRDSEQGLYSLLLKQSRANGCWGFRAWESCWKLPPRHDHSPEEDVVVLSRLQPHQRRLLRRLQPRQRRLLDLGLCLQYSDAVNFASLGGNDVSTLRTQLQPCHQAHPSTHPVPSLSLSQHHLCPNVSQRGSYVGSLETHNMTSPQGRQFLHQGLKLLLFTSVWERHTHHPHWAMTHPDVLGSLSIQMCWALWATLEHACLFCHP